MTACPTCLRLIALVCAVTAAVAVTLAIVLAVSRPDTQPSPPVSTAVPATGWAALMPEAVFFSALDAKGIRYDRDDMRRLGEAVCTALRNGVTLPGAALLLTRDGYPPYDAGYIVGAASRSLCLQK